MTIFTDTKNGTYIQKARLRIFLPADVLENAKMAAMPKISALRSGEGQSGITADEWDAEIRRLVALAEDIVKKYPAGLDIFKYLPLRPGMKFPKRAHILLADSRCFFTSRWHDGSYFNDHAMQLRLVPLYDGTIDGRPGPLVEDTMALSVDWFDTSARKASVSRDPSKWPYVTAKPIP